MADKRITDFAALEEAQNDDYVLVASGEETYKMALKTIRRIMGPVIVEGVSTDGGETYAATVDNINLEFGTRIIFVPQHQNAVDAPTLAINDGDPYKIYVRAPEDQGENPLRPEATLPALAGSLMRGVPYTLIYCTEFWLMESAIGSVKALLDMIGDLSELYTAEKSNLVAAINELISMLPVMGVPIANATAEDGVSYAATGTDLPLVTMDPTDPDGTTLIGQGMQVLFVPSTTNTAAAPTLSLNNGTALELRRRVFSGSEITEEVAAGDLIAGMPYVLTCWETYWLIETVASVGEGSTDGSEGTQQVYTDKSSEFAAQEVYSSAMDYLRSLGVGKWRVLDDSNCRYSIEVINVNGYEWWFEEILSDDPFYTREIWVNKDCVYHEDTETGAINIAGRRVVTGENVLRYAAQELEDTQQSQARANIGAQAAFIGTDSVGRGMYVGLDGNLTADAVPDEAKLKEYAYLFNGKKLVESFLLFSDPHLFVTGGDLASFRKNLWKYLRPVKNYYELTPTSFVICNGDLIEDDDTQKEASYKLSANDAVLDKWFNKCYLALGNHEHNSNGVKLLTKNTVRNLLLREQEANYYSFKGANTTFYVLDTDSDASLSMSDYLWEQIDWLATRLIEDDPMFAAIVAHGFHKKADDDSRVLTDFSYQLFEILSAYNAKTTIEANGITYDFTACTGFVEFALGGHIHQDKYEEVSGIPLVITTHLRTGSVSTFDLVLADYYGRKLQFVRIGDGESRTIELPERAELLNYTNLVPTSTSPVTGEIYNGVGYKDDTRYANAAAGYEQAAEGYVLTGVIPYPVSTQKLPSTIYIKGDIVIDVEATEASTSGIMFFAEDKTTHKGLMNWSSVASCFELTELDSGYYSLVPKLNTAGTWATIINNFGTGITGMTITLCGVGEGLVVTLDEPIE